MSKDASDHPSGGLQFDKTFSIVNSWAEPSLESSVKISLLGNTHATADT